jgi:VWFA-related protein
VLAFDASGSVAGQSVEDLRAGGRALLAGLRSHDQAALIAFSDELRVVVPQEGDRSAVERALDDLRPRGVTGLWDGLYAGLKLPVSRGRPMVVVFTDGEDNVSWLTREQVHRVAEESDAVVYVVAIVSDPDEQRPFGGLGAMPTLMSVPRARNAETPALGALRELAEATGGRLWPASSSAQLKPTFLRILTEMRERYLLSYEPEGVKREGRHRLDVKVKGQRGAAVRSRPGYFVAPRAAP